MRIIENIKYKLKANKLLKLNKSLEELNDEELSLEFNIRLKEINRNKTIDNRSNEIIEMFLKRTTREKNAGFNRNNIKIFII